ncbi:hypothetical protein ACJMK2_032262 [Sinanodonta woodiana]|uniref:BHLH domain-containing protein n=1 Tax=Sinanodonta woodiana TaxID=1069815 RepID=A0ABD3X2N2_SINWO
MSLGVGAYGQGYSHPGPMVPHEFYQYPQMRYPDYSDRTYFHNWIFGGPSPDYPMSPESYNSAPTPSPTDICNLGHYEPYNGHMVVERCVKRRTSANKKERRRTLSINTAFSNLRGCIPNVPSDTKLSKIKTLRLAISYISYLMDVLQKNDPSLAEAGFKAELSRKRERRDEKKVESESDDACSTSSSSSSSEKKPSKGRTGWPEHVWASELKQQ